MNREIKFRAWDNKNKKWLLGYDYPNLGGFSLTGECVLFGEWGNVFDTFLFNKDGKKYDDLKIMQFTGLKDKNGVDIYEGDIIKTGRNDDWGVIVYKAPFFEVTVSEEQSCMYTREWFANVETIGNIYQNPELLTN